MDEIKAEGYALIDGILQDPNQIIEPLIESDSKPSFADDNNDGYKCLVCNIALFRLKEVIGHVLTVHCSKGINFDCIFTDLNFPPKPFSQVNRKIIGSYFFIK